MTIMMTGKAIVYDSDVMI